MKVFLENRQSFFTKQRLPECKPLLFNDTNQNKLMAKGFCIWWLCTAALGWGDPTLPSYWYSLVPTSGTAFWRQSMLFLCRSINRIL